VNLKHIFKHPGKPLHEVFELLIRLVLRTRRYPYEYPLKVGPDKDFEILVDGVGPDPLDRGKSGQG